MSIANPLSISVNTVEKLLPKINQDGYGSEYFLRNSTESYRAKVRHSTQKTKEGLEFSRHNVELTRTIFGSGDTRDKVITCYIVIIDDPQMSDDDTKYTQKALNDLVSTSFVVDLRGWQN